VGQKKYNPCQASYPHELRAPQLYDFLAVRATFAVRRVASLREVGEGVICRSSRLRFAASRLAAPRRLTAALAPAAPSDDTLTSLHRSVPARPSNARPLRILERLASRVYARITRARWSFRHAGRRREAPRAREELFLPELGRWGATRRNATIPSLGRREQVSSEGAAGASAAARPHGAASRKATLQARAPEEDTRARLTGENQIYATLGRRYTEKLTARRNPRARS
jgi:hypothetical protein